MGHIEDRWFKTVPGVAGQKPIRTRTDRCGKGDRYRVRYIAPDGRERSKSFPDRAKRAAEEFLAGVESDKIRGTYVDPSAGKQPFDQFAEQWLRSHPLDESTRPTVRSRVRNHLIPYFGGRGIGAIRPSTVRDWDREMIAKKLANNTRVVLFAHLSGILTSAVDDGLIAKNPCSAKSVKAPTSTLPEIVPWPFEVVAAVRDGVPLRYRPVVDLGAGCGLRQGEIFGVSPHDFDFGTEWLTVRRQVKRVGSQLVFGLPKNDKERRVPLPGRVAAAIRRHLDTFRTVPVTLPWEDPVHGKAVTVPLLFVTQRGSAVRQQVAANQIWHPALKAAGVEVCRVNGMHALRHLYASALLDAGENIKALAEWLGHADPAFTLRVYAHLMPESPKRARRAVDALLSGLPGSHGPETAPDHV
ncbi:tyrosine-type recombinase/integrase [Paractinoplanes lichenicola]|uniref:Site-specific integrase n=1 Tax=Paractinoplanes lichenicola TaxID=2802976 RepID=A0ABS1VXG0_9ACTN|nr:tyrosine-type recombinase/integrase [Actinoplanes lichenicola]MBL7259171.1 site-specific integrase [Actinoplanes lichenicola]